MVAWRPIVAFVLAAAMGFGAVPSSAQQQPVTSAPYETKIGCIALNVYLMQQEPEDSPAYREAERRAETWAMAALEHTNGDSDKVEIDLESMLFSINLIIPGDKTGDVLKALKNECGQFAV